MHYFDWRIWYTRVPNKVEMLIIVTTKNTFADWITLSATTATNIA